MAILIELTKGYKAEIDEIDADLQQYRWCAVTCHGNKVYTRRSRPKAEWDKGRFIVMHRVILGRVVERELQKHEYVDHIDGNSLNNTRANLRLATHSQNIANNRRKKNISKTGYKGVYPNGNGYQSVIIVNNKRIYLGTFRTPEEAHEAHKVASLKHFGQFSSYYKSA